jgi:hypothetical protein
VASSRVRAVNCLSFQGCVTSQFIGSYELLDPQKCFEFWLCAAVEEVEAGDLELLGKHDGSSGTSLDLPSTHLGVEDQELRRRSQIAPQDLESIASVGFLGKIRAPIPGWMQISDDPCCLFPTLTVWSKGDPRLPAKSWVGEEDQWFWAMMFFDRPSRSRLECAVRSLCSTGSQPNPKCTKSVTNTLHEFEGICRGFATPDPRVLQSSQ